MNCDNLIKSGNFVQYLTLSYCSVLQPTGFRFFGKKIIIFRSVLNVAVVN